MKKLKKIIPLILSALLFINMIPRAQAYSPQILGDLDGDGGLTACDKVLLVRMMTKETAETPQGDVDCDGFVGFSDNQALGSFLLGASEKISCIYPVYIGIPETLALEKGASAQLEPELYPADCVDSALIWKSADKTIATVSGGMITAIKAGKTVITAYSQNGSSAACTVTVTEPSEPEYSAHVTGVTSYLRVRSSPSTEGDIIGSFGPGQALTVIGAETNGWYRVRGLDRESGRTIEGYSSAEYITLDGAETTPPDTTAEPPAETTAPPPETTVPPPETTPADTTEAEHSARITGITSYLRVREIPSTDGEIVGSFAPDQVITVIGEETDGWYHVRGLDRESGQMIEGYSSADFITLDGDSPVTDDFEAKIAALRIKFPQGKYWNHTAGASFSADGYTSTPCSHHVGECLYNGSCGCNSFDLAIQCMGYAFKLGYDLYGISPRKWTAVSSYDDMQPGDYLRYNGHSMIVLTKTSAGITVAECNYDGKCGIFWDRFISADTVKKYTLDIRRHP